MGGVLVEELRRIGLEAGLDALGVASAEPFESTRRDLEDRAGEGLADTMQFTYRNPARSTDAHATLPSAETMVVGARSYLRPPVSRPTSGRPLARVARYAQHDEYAALRSALNAVADRLRKEGHRAVVVADQNALVDREAAHRAGLGWYGKSSNLLLSGSGSWFVLGSVITDAPLPTESTPVEDGCGTCVRCIDECPTGAIVRPGVVDAGRCLAWLVQREGVFPRERRRELGDRIYGCDDCQEVCPPSRVVVRRVADEPTKATPAAEAADLAFVDLIDILEADDQTLMERYGRWYIPRREARYLRRNALIVLGNVGSGSDAETRRVLTRCLADSDDLVRAHAVWAAGQLDLTDLLAAAADDTSELVQDELRALEVSAA